MRKIVFLLAIISFASCAVLERSRMPKTFDVHWNSSNPQFEPFLNAIDTPGYWEISASPHDVIRFICPKRQDGNKELLYVYKVSQSDFERCCLSESANKVVECTSLHTHVTVRHTLRREYGLGDVYYITTSTGSSSGLDNQRFGLCLSNNMRMAVHFEQKIKNIDSTESFDDLPTELESGRIFDRSGHGEIFLAEENGIMSWKKNVFPKGPTDDFHHYANFHSDSIDTNNQSSYIDLELEKANFENSKQVEPMPIDDDIVNFMEKERRNEIGDYDYPNDVRVLELGGTILIHSPLTGKFEELPDAASRMPIASIMLTLSLAMFVF